MNSSDVTILSFKHWIQSEMIFVKDIFNDDGKFLNETFVLSKLHTKTDWFREVMIDTDGCKYISIQNMYLH